ncbi:hypothetical protein [Caldimonas sp.]|uniref:hypothetical protein n=1 Tax=Caldimonas sp. TaxID=2838790 RepID=UPI003918F3A5
MAPFVLSDRAAHSLPLVLAVVRVLFGLMIVHQMLDIFGFAMLPGGPDPRVARLISALAAIGGAMLALGALTPLAVVGLLIYYALFPLAFNLGTMVTVALLWGLLLHGAGRTHSLDALLLRSRLAGTWMARFYAPFGAGGRQEIAGVRLMVMLMFWGNCITAMLYHVKDPFWLNGQVLQMAFTASYLTDHHAFMAALREQHPRFFMAFCQLGLAIQAVWEVCLVPLMYLKWARPFVVLQGLGFFTFSLLLLNLQYLPVVELLLWTLLFGPAILGWVREKWRQEAPAPAGEEPAPAVAPLTIARHLPTLIGLTCGAVVVQNAVAPGLMPTELAKPMKPIHQALAPYYRLFGQEVVNVFNQGDIGMNEAYFVVQEVDPAGRHRRIVPFYDHEGGRLDYMRNDLLYFKYSLKWQRAKREHKFIAGDPARPAAPTRQLAFRVALLDAVMTDVTRPRQYRAHVYVRQMRLDTTPPRWTQPQRAGSFPLTITSAHLSRFRAMRWPTFDLPPGHAFSRERLQQTEEAFRKVDAAAPKPAP